MPSNQKGRSSRARYGRYRERLRNHDTEGSRRTAAAHAATRSRDERRSFGQLFRAFWGLLRGNRALLCACLASVSIVALLSLFPPAATGFVFDYVFDDQPLSESAWFADLTLPEEPRTLLTAIALGLLAIAVIQLGLGLWGRWHATLITKRLQSSIRRRVFEHAVRLPLHRVHELKSGGVASILREDAGGIAELVFSMFYNPWRAIVRVVSTIAVLAVIDWRLLLGSLVLLPTVFYTHRTWIARIRPMWRDIRASRTHMDAHATEAFGGMRVVRAFGRQRRETARFTGNNHLMIRQEIMAWWWSRGIDVAWQILIPVATAGLLWYGGTRVLDGTLQPGQLIAFLLYLAMLLEPLAQLASSATAFQNSLAGLDRVLDLEAEPLEMSHAGMNTEPFDRTTVRGDVALEHVSFQYPDRDDAVLDDVSLNVPTGTTVALVGPSGSGKTTICNLIARFYDPSNGRILLDGRDLRTIDVEQYRRLLGIVEQDIFLFDGTIADNIAYARRGATEEDITNAATLANAHDFIMEFAEGYDTLIGERGVRLSGGQRQRIAIARAILADPSILILDEATSNLDTESERLIQAGLETLMRDRTTFVIAHRLSTIRKADQIIVVDNGQVIEQGRHEDLLNNSGRYAHMVELQTADANAE